MSFYCGAYFCEYNHFYNFLLTEKTIIEYVEGTG